MNGNFALDAILTRAFRENNVDLATLQVEDNGRNVASLQGHIAGYKDLVKIISEEFVVSPGWCSIAQDSAEEDVILADMSDEAMNELCADVKNLIENSEAWERVLRRIEEKTIQLKDQLFTNGHSTRDLDLAQGHYYGMTIYESFFNAIDNEVERREKEKREKKEELPFNEDGPAGEPGVSCANPLQSKALGEELEDEEGRPA